MYCHAGNIDCKQMMGSECFALRTGPDRPFVLITKEFELCPFPSRAQKEEDKYEKAFDIFMSKQIKRGSDYMWREDFLSALKEAGLQ